MSSRGLLFRRLRPWLGGLFSVVALHVPVVGGTEGQGSPLRGLPLLRTYPFEEIGSVSQGSRLDFDGLGRLRVLQDGALIALNDALWIDQAAHGEGAPDILRVVKGSDGVEYFGALGTWGRVTRNREGKCVGISLTPADVPKWVRTNSFTDLHATQDAVYFGGWNGVVRLDLRTGSCVYSETPEINASFLLKGRFYACTERKGIEVWDSALGGLVPAEGGSGALLAVDHAVSLGDDHVLLSTIDGGLHRYDGKLVEDWRLKGVETTQQKISALCRLAEGGVAVAVTGRGVLFCEPDGTVRYALNSPEFHRVTEMAANEPGVLFLVSDDGLQKVLYGAPVSLFGQRQGLPVTWPQMALWRGSLIVASSGRLYESLPRANAEATQFRPVEGVGPGSAWGVASSGEHLLFGGGQMIYELSKDGRPSLVAAGIDVAKLVMVGADLCYVIGQSEIALLRHEGGNWREAAPRIKGIGYPSIVRSAGDSAWVELGPNRAARVFFRDGRLQTRLFENFPWSEPKWINIGAVGNIVVLTGPDRRSIFFDENTGELCEAPRLERLLKRSPYSITRLTSDSKGNLWATHSRGIFRITMKGDEDLYDASTFSIIDDRAPYIQILGGDDIWFSSGHALYHVEEGPGRLQAPAAGPFLVSATDVKTREELAAREVVETGALVLAHAQNNPGFRFFSGGYANRFAPSYEFRLGGETGSWLTFGADSLLTLHDLKEGSYQLEVRVVDGHGPVGGVRSFSFLVLPPWYRTTSAYVLYAGALLFGFYAAGRFFDYRTRARTRELESLVTERTEELKRTMERLKDETRNAATLAERARLAGEIHDGLQQGLSGLILHLDAMLKVASLAPDLRAKLSVARNMASFTRQEVQHAVWDMESPLLDHVELEDALRRLKHLNGLGADQMEIAVSGKVAPLSSRVKHHLVRLAQEGITNAVRHGKSRQIRVLIDYADEAVKLTVRDDGCGFRVAEALGAGLGHFGLRGLQARADKIGGVLHLDSEPGKGTTVSIRVPLGGDAGKDPNAIHIL